MSILGSSLVLRTDEHLKVTMFDEKMSKGALLVTDLLATACIFAHFAVFMFVYGRQLMQKARTNTMAGVNSPYAWISVLPVTGVLYVLALITQWTGGLVSDGTTVAATLLLIGLFLVLVFLRVPSYTPSVSRPWLISLPGHQSHADGP